jgi:hypothetical protein
MFDAEIRLALTGLPYEEPGSHCCTAVPSDHLRAVKRVLPNIMYPNRLRTVMCRAVAVASRSHAARIGA